MRKLFVYGTLMQGQRLHQFLEKAKFLESIPLYGYTLYDSGYSYPFAIESDKENYILGEIYQVKEEDYQDIRDMELAAGFTERYDEDYKVWLFIMPKNNPFMTGFSYPLEETW